MYNFDATREPDIGASQPTNKYIISSQKGTDGSGKELFYLGQSAGDSEKVIFSTRCRRQPETREDVACSGQQRKGKWLSIACDGPAHPTCHGIWEHLSSAKLGCDWPTAELRGTEPQLSSPFGSDLPNSSVNIVSPSQTNERSNRLWEADLVATVWTRRVP